MRLQIMAILGKMVKRRRKVPTYYYRPIFEGNQDRKPPFERTRPDAVKGPFGNDWQILGHFVSWQIGCSIDPHMSLCLSSGDPSIASLHYPASSPEIKEGRLMMAPKFLPPSCKPWAVAEQEDDDEEESDWPRSSPSPGPEETTEEGVEIIWVPDGIPCRSPRQSSLALPPTHTHLPLMNKVGTADRTDLPRPVSDACLS
ncbi:hypothetical protein TWF696_003562 [Orbilia brochopaga]|uniref:Uncharacterized protein n=1 Tax=Orbilia brochopaga TaxID=3140254 RepID=A0AAV9TWB0_9PEZI